MLAIFSLAGCSLTDKVAFSDEEYAEKSSRVAIKESEKQAEIATKREKSIEKTEDKIGKTTKNEKVVSKQVFATSTVYEVMNFDSEGMLKNVYYYEYFNDANSYYLEKNVGELEDKKRIEYDDEIYLIVYKSKKVYEGSFDTFYNLRSKSSAYEVIE